MKHQILNCAVVKGTGNPVYLILHGKKYEIESEQVAEMLFTRPYHTKVSDKCLNALPAGEPLSASSRLVAGPDRTVYLSINDHIKLPFSDTAAFDDMGFDAGRVQVLSDAELGHIPTGEPIAMGMWEWEHEDWMSCLPNETLLSSISIPGTHDSMSYTRYQELNSGNADKSGDKSITMDEILQKLKNNVLGVTAACQSKSLEEQLKMGARFFDLRLDHKMYFFHGITPLNLMSEGAMQPLTKFLNEHPDETIFLRMKSENTNEEATYRKAFERDVIARYRSYFWNWSENYNGAGIKDEHGVVIPTLGETRGKIILFNSYQLEEAQPGGKKDYIGYQLHFYTPASAGEHFPLTCQHLQDEYKLGSKPEKLAAIKENAWAADKCTDSMYYINFTSAVDFVPVPLLCAMNNNPKVEKFLVEEIRNRTGIVPMDFMGEDEKVTLWVLFINFRRHSLI